MEEAGLTEVESLQVRVVAPGVRGGVGGGARWRGRGRDEEGLKNVGAQRTLKGDESPSF